MRVGKNVEMTQPPVATQDRPGEADLRDELGARALAAADDACAHLRAGRHVAAADVVTRLLTDDGTEPTPELTPAGRALLLGVRAAARLQVGWQAETPAYPSATLGDGRFGPAPGRMVDVLDGLDDVAEAEVLLGAVDGAAGGPAHAALARIFSALRLYELALPHADRAVSAQPSTQVESVMQIAALHLAWAEDLERVGEIDECRAHVESALTWWRQVEERVDGTPWRPLVELLGADIRARLDPEAGLAPLVHISRGGTGLQAAALPTLARVQRALGRPVEAAATARQALGDDDPSNDTRRAACYQLYAAARDQGLPGAVGVSRLVELCTADLWDQRRNALDGVQARRELAVVRAERSETHRLTLLDPLTEVGNRRALSAWLAAHPVGPAVVVMADVDDFKVINDRWGHELGDLALRRLARALRRRLAELGPDTLLVRYGGDEFVLLTALPETTEESLGTLAHRAAAEVLASDLVADLEIRLTLGGAVAQPGASIAPLVDQADRALLSAKRRRHADGSGTVRRGRR